MKVPPSHIHGLDRCEHDFAGEEVHWLCGMHPVWTNRATANTVDLTADRAAFLARYLSPSGRGTIMDGDPLPTYEELLEYDEIEERWAQNPHAHDGLDDHYATGRRIEETRPL